MPDDPARPLFFFSPDEQPEKPRRPLTGEDFRLMLGDLFLTKRPPREPAVFVTRAEAERIERDLRNLNDPS